jgi:transposase
MWTKESRSRYDRSGLRYPSDLTDGEWAILSPLIPPAKRGGRPREVDIRAVIGGLLYVLETGCPWRHLPKDFPPKSTVHSYFELWAWDGTLARIHDALYVAMREQEGREASPSAALLDSQSAKSMQKGGARLIRSDSMRARRSRGSSATSSPTIRASCSLPWSMRRAFRTATARRSS